MQSEYLKYVGLRVYKNLSTRNLLNAIMCNRIMKNSFMVENSRHIYNISLKIFGKNFVNSLLSATFCKLLTAGNSLEEADKVSNYYRSEKIPVILDYCAEGSLDLHIDDSLLELNAALFAESASKLINQQNQMISIKITGLINMHTLKALNESVQMRNRFWLQNNVDGKLKAPQFFEALQKKYAGLTEQQFETYTQKIYHYQGSISNFQVDEVDFKMKHHPFYLYQSQKNDDFVIKLFSPFTKNQWQQFNVMKNRIEKIVLPFSEVHFNQIKNKNNFRVLIDAEQSYVQFAIECLSQQMQEKYNKNKTYIIPTIQNYLKRSVERAHYEIEIAKRKNLKFAAKLVRGAYFVEENKITKKNNTQNPIVDTFEKTTFNYMKNFENIIKSFNDGELIVATHNVKTVEQAQKIYKQTGSQIKISFAQLVGLADHLTWKIKIDNFTVYKYLPWAQTEVMISYMIRRAEQLNQMRYPLDIQQKLLVQELKSRYFKRT